MPRNQIEVELKSKETKLGSLLLKHKKLLAITFKFYPKILNHLLIWQIGSGKWRKLELV
jgi:hypothetical protein